MSKQIYYPHCEDCKKSLIVNGRGNQKKYCDDCLIIRKKARNKKYREESLKGLARKTKPAYLDPKHIEFIKVTGMNFSSFVRTKLDEEMLR